MKYESGNINLCEQKRGFIFCQQRVGTADIVQQLADRASAGQLSFQPGAAASYFPADRRCRRYWASPSFTSLPDTQT